MFIDDSFQAEANFVAIAFVCSETDVEADVVTALIDAGLRPGVDEFKSSAPMSGSPELQRLRKRLRQTIIQSYAPIALLFASADRRALPHAVVTTLAQLVENNRLNPDQHVFVDQGIFKSAEQVRRLTAAEPALARCVVYWREDSRVRVGIQLADLVANAGAYIVKEQMNGAGKTVHLGAESGYGDDGIDVELGWFMKMLLRRNFLCERKEFDDSMENLDPYFTRHLLGYGLFMSDDLPLPVRIATETALGATWLGCLH